MNIPSVGHVIVGNASRLLLGSDVMSSLTGGREGEKLRKSWIRKKHPLSYYYDADNTNKWPVVNAVIPPIAIMTFNVTPAYSRT